MLARAVEIARAHRARLTIVHVIDNFTGHNLAPTYLSLIQGQMRSIARENIEAAITKQEVGGIKIDIRIVIGSPSLQLIELTDEISADLVVIRAHRGGSILDKMIGSTTDRVIRATRVPVLVVKRPVTQAYQRILVAAETTERFGAVVALVAALFPLAGLHLAHVLHIPPQLEEAMLRAGSGQTGIMSHRDALMHKAKAYMHDMSEKLANRPVRSTTKVAIGDPAQSLVRMTRNSKVNLIVLGPDSTSIIMRALLGSVTRKVLRAATCDVLICRTAQQDAAE